ncbi:hypothetical protein GCK72_019063 [Caenorhabditis remanei]|uniref:PAN-3 domain-containing protein n=1 Tax=Caenorhabditis remanei TaxID=31234 RepID=A0A6A5GBM7_CAERE|nr:hypothetical protein GCK72_019063 [Caenorhabditis remanei]KAF1752508.1 hypothetical protein GCK72_019063 [Caenorhabditis remanei]
MVVTWGKPLREPGLTMFNITWKECIQECWMDSNCVLVYDTSPTCQKYSIEIINTVEKLPPNSGNRSDVQRDSTIYVTNQYIPINITLENSIWTFTQRNAAFACPNLATPIRRGNNIWCMVAMATGNCINRTQAEASCVSMYNRSVAGVANKEEYEFLKNAAMNHLTNPSDYTVPPGYTRLGFWIDGIRKTECKYPSTIGVSCNGTNEFYYNDSFAQTPALDWNTGQPDGLSKRTNDDCVALLVQTGKSGIEDIGCEVKEITESKLCMVGYFCGKSIGQDTWELN